MLKMSNKKLFIFFFLFLVAISATAFNHIQAEEVEYNLLAPIPLSGGADPTDATIPSNYIKGIFILIIASASVLAVLRIIFAGIKYMSTDAFQNKSEAKGDIQNAIWGLVLAMGAFLILNTINPSLTNLNLEIPGLKTGGELGGDLGIIPNTDEANKVRADIGCTQNCAQVLLEDGQIGTSNPNPPGPRNVSGSGCDSALTPVCWINTDLYKKLQELTRTTTTHNDLVRSPGENSSLAVMWVVTEMFPPTVDHRHACHKPDTAVTAQCVDVGISNLNCANQNNCSNRQLIYDGKRIKFFIDEAMKLGLWVEYETKDQGRYTALRGRLIEEGMPSSVVDKVLISPQHITGEHFSVYLNYQVSEYRGN